MKIIAEAGCNWKTITEAKLMIKKSKDSGCWATKFQLFSKEMAEEVKIPKYLSLSKGQAKSLVKYGKFIGINVFFTPMDVERVGWCEEIGVDFIKVRLKDNLNQDLYKTIKKTGKKVFISINEYNDLWQNIVDYKRGVFFYCVPKYPAKIEDYFQDSFFSYGGISDHTGGIELLKKSIDFGFEYHEIHICLTKDCLEADWSVTFEELKEVLQ